MPRIYDDIRARCPFFKQSGRKNVMCEGITDTCVLNVLFDTEEDRNLHRKLFCDADYHKCDVNTMLEKKYD